MKRAERIGFVPWLIVTGYTFPSTFPITNFEAVGENGIVLYGIEKGIISNLTFEGLDFNIKNGSFQRSYGGNFDLRPNDDPSLSLFSHDIPVIFLKNVDNVRMIDSKMVF